MTARLISITCALLFLTACGGGGGKPTSTPDSRVPQADQLTNTNQIYTSASTEIRQASESVASATPNFGSVTQSSNRNNVNVTTDVAQTTFDGENLAVQITHGASNSTAFDSATNVVIDDTAATDSPVRANYRRRQYTIGSLSGDTGTLARIGVDWNQGNAATDYLAFGHWLRVNDIDSSPTAQVGVFIDGPELRETPTVPTAGTATYQGTAQGLHTVLYGNGFSPPAGHVGYGAFTADATLRANFETGMINGTVSNFFVNESQVNPQTGELRERSSSYQGHRPPFVLTLADTRIGNGAFTGDATLSTTSTSFSVTSSDGAWGGRFSSRPTSATEAAPRLVGGTFAGHGVLNDGTRSEWVGTFGATKQ